MNKYIIEAIGTFFLVLTIGLSVTVGTAALAPIAIGFILMVMIFMGGHISGGHFNPAVTVGVRLRGKASSTDAIFYIVAQTIGGLIAAFIAAGIAIQGGATAALVAPGEGFGTMTAIIIEVLFTFALVSVVLNTATSSDHPNNSFYGLAIGCTVVAAAIAGGPISGGAFNPAVGIGLNAAAQDLSQVWIYIVGPVIGGILASVVFRITNPHEFA